MAYIYQVNFSIEHDQMEQLRIGANLEEVLGYLRTLLPNMPGFITARAMFSVDLPGKTHLIIQSIWDQWEDLLAHKESNLAEQRILKSFQPHVALEDLAVHIFEEVP
jgi:heme-degrading monooxygenase HmoA